MFYYWWFDQIRGAEIPPLAGKCWRKMLLSTMRACSDTFVFFQCPVLGTKLSRWGSVLISFCRAVRPTFFVRMEVARVDDNQIYGAFRFVSIRERQSFVRASRKLVS